MNLISDNIDFSAYMESTEYAHRVLPSGAFEEEVVALFHDHSAPKGAPMAFGKMQDKVRFRDGEVSIWNGINGHGKSLVLGQLLMGFMAQELRTCVASFEMKPFRTIARMVRQASGVAVPSERYIRDWHRRTDQWMWLYDQQGMVRSDRVLALARYCHDKLAIKHFVIDSLMKCGVPEGEGAALQKQKEFVDQVCTIARDTGMHIHLVTHSKKSRDENEPPGKMDVAGAAAITNQPDNVFHVWRNKPKERARAAGEPVDVHDPDCLVLCDKQRNGDWEGVIKLYAHYESMQFLEQPHALPRDLLSPPIPAR